jgi:hypothetical protein
MLVAEVAVEIIPMLVVLVVLAVEDQGQQELKEQAVMELQTQAVVVVEDMQQAQINQAAQAVQASL